MFPLSMVVLMYSICANAILIFNIESLIDFSYAQAIEEEAINFVDQSFKTLRSSAAALEMLLKFKNIRSREAINNHLKRKFNDILIQYCKEVPYCEIQKGCWVPGFDFSVKRCDDQ